MNLDNINTDVMFQKLLDKMKELDAMRERKEIPGRKDLLDYLILRFRIEAPDNYLITTEQGTDSITITIESTEILCIDEVPTLKQLINIASYFKIYPHDRNVILKLTCPLMEWKEKRLSLLRLKNRKAAALFRSFWDSYDIVIAPILT